MVPMFLSLHPFCIKNKVFKNFTIFFHLRKYFMHCNQYPILKFRLVPLCRIFADLVTYYALTNSMLVYLLYISKILNSISIFLLSCCYKHYSMLAQCMEWILQTLLYNVMYSISKYASFWSLLVVLCREVILLKY